jgi:hypothetical protein
LEQSKNAGEHTVEYITGGREPLRVDHIQLDPAGEEAAG